jgi:hypothetical protein
MFSASVGVADTVGPTINDRAFAPVNTPGNFFTGNQQPYAESYKTYMGSVALTAPDSMGFLSGSTLYAGIVNGFNDAVPNAAANSQSSVSTSYYVGATVATPVTGLRLGASFDLLDVAQAANNDWSFAGYLSYQATEKLSFHARAEYFKDKLNNALGQSGHEVLFGNTYNVNGTPVAIAGDGAQVMSLTGTVQYDLWKNVISRLELRWDHSLAGNALFGSNNALVNPTADAQNAVMLSANIIYKF